MATKTITIMEDAYEMLNRLKKGDESFSEVIRGLAKSRRGSVEAVLECAGLWKDMPDKDIEEMKKRIEGMRRRSSKRLIERVKDL